MFTIYPTDDERVIELEIKGDVTKEDYALLEDAIKEKLKEMEHVNLLCRITEFSGITAQAVLKDFKLFIKHYSNIRKMAVISTKDWIEWMTKLGAVLPVEMKHFELDDYDQAQRWVKE